MDYKFTSDQDTVIKMSLTADEAKALFGTNHTDKHYFSLDYFRKLCPRRGELSFHYYHGLQALRKWDAIFRDRWENGEALFQRGDLECPSFHFAALSLVKKL